MYVLYVFVGCFMLCRMLLLFLCLCFFFFKQKTAYEMRISDWSSDVCSSDLEGVYEGTISAVTTKESNDKTKKGLVITYTVTDEESPMEIGRASCRERVCQYV